MKTSLVSASCRYVSRVSTFNQLSRLLLLPCFSDGITLDVLIRHSRNTAVLFSKRVFFAEASSVGSSVAAICSSIDPRSLVTHGFTHFDGHFLGRTTREREWDDDGRRMAPFSFHLAPRKASQFPRDATLGPVMAASYLASD